MSALFNFTSMLRTVTLLVCTSAYVKKHAPAILNKDNRYTSLLYRASVVGERLSPYVSIMCMYFGIAKLKSFLW